MLKVITVLVIVTVVTIAVSYFAFDFLPWLPAAPGGDSGVPALTPPPPASSPTPSPKPVSTQATPRPTPSPTNNPVDKKVTFEFAITEVTGSGLSRTVTAQMKNTGQADAHNTWAKVEVFSGTSRIKLDKKDYLMIELGTVGAGQTVERQVALSFGITDAPKLLQNGATFRLTITSDEHTETFSYDYSP